jgi:hypothetical protein
LRQLAKDLAPLLVHTAFCLLSAIALRYALGSGAYAILIGLLLVFLAIVLPTLLFGWPPPYGYLSASLEQVPARRGMLAGLGAALVGYAAFSVVTLRSAFMGVAPNAVAFAVGAALLYFAHRGVQRTQAEV